MPKQTPSIPNEVLWAELEDRDTLSDELWLIAAQVGMLPGRSTDQLSEDRKVGNPPRFKKDGGSIRYRLGSVRDHMFGLPELNNTTQARIAAEKSRFGIYSSFLTWVDQAEPDDLWPCLISHDDGPIDFWTPLTLGDKLSDDDRCEFLRHDCFLVLRAIWGHPPTQELLAGDDVKPENACDSKVMVSHLEFVDFLDVLARQIAEPPTPLRITSAPFDKIYAPEHLLWIRQILNSTGKHKEPLDQKMYALLHEAYKCKSSYWTIHDAIYTLLNESTVIYTPSRELKRAEIAEWINQAECAARDKVFPSVVDSSGSIVVKPIPESVFH